MEREREEDDEYSRGTAHFCCASTFSAAEQKAKLSQHFIHVAPHVRTPGLPYITSSASERGEAKCRVYKCYSLFSHKVWLTANHPARARRSAASLASVHDCLLSGGALANNSRPPRGVSSLSRFRNNPCCCRRRIFRQKQELLLN